MLVLEARCLDGAWLCSGEEAAGAVRLIRGHFRLGVRTRDRLRRLAFAGQASGFLAPAELRKAHATPILASCHKQEKA